MTHWDNLATILGAVFSFNLAAVYPPRHSDAGIRGRLNRTDQFSGFSKVFFALDDKLGCVDDRGWSCVGECECVCVCGGGGYSERNGGGREGERVSEREKEREREEGGGGSVCVGTCERE